MNFVATVVISNIRVSLVIGNYIIQRKAVLPYKVFPFTYLWNGVPNDCRFPSILKDFFKYNLSIAPNAKD